jgi:hypothetical protein
MQISMTAINSKPLSSHVTYPNMGMIKKNITDKLIT